MSHIEKISFCGLRRLNQFKSDSPNIFKHWLDEREWHDFSTVNIFIGANGSGKSTVLELIDFLRAPDRIVTLARENNKRNCLTAFNIILKNGAHLIGSVASSRIVGQPEAANIDKATDGLDIQFLSMAAFKADGLFFYFEKNISKVELDLCSRNEITDGFRQFNVQVVFWSPDVKIEEGRLVVELNALRQHLPGVLSEAEWPNDGPEVGNDHLMQYQTSHPFQKYDNGRIAVYLSDDSGQHNHVHVDALPAGWRQVAKLLNWLRECPDGAICLIEEPETHLHPFLQRYLAKQMGQIATDRALQLFISTHSSVFQQINVWPLATNIFEARPERLAKLNSAWRVLDALGIKGSDISQSNGVIWVEGASDRIYIKHWLKIYCEKTGLDEPLENIEYSFSFYGGAALAHFSIDEENCFIDMISINRNLIMVMDRDNDFDGGEHGEMICMKKSSAKSRILDELKTFGSERCYAWITDYYTIESYLPEIFRSLYFDEEEGRLVLRKHHKKVAVAAQYLKNFPQMDACARSPEKLFAHIEKLRKTIRAWGH